MPLTIGLDSIPYPFQHLSHVRAIIEEESVTANDSSSLLTEAYGAHVLKCSILSCSRFRNGFKSEQKRNEHQLSHVDHFECTHDGCDRAILGFTTRQALVRHLAEHQPLPEEPAFPKIQRYSLKKSLELAIDTNDAVAVRTLAAEATASALLDRSLLRRALNKRCCEAAKVLLELWPFEHNQRAETKLAEFAIEVAAEKGDEELANLAVGMNTYMNINSYVTVLLLASKYDHSNIVRLILSLDLMVGLSLAKKTELVMNAASYGRWEITWALLDKYQLDHDTSNVLLRVYREANFKGHRSAFDHICSKGREILSEDNFLDLAHGMVLEILHYIQDIGSKINANRLDGYVNNILYLIDAGVNVNMKPNSEDSILTVAATTGNLSFIQQLLDRGADFDAYAGQVLVRTARNGHEAVVKLLLEFGANSGTYPGQALVQAAAYGHETVAELLLEFGADVNVDAGLALVEATANGHEAVVKLLLHRGADVNARAKYLSGVRRRAWWFAVLEGHQGVLKLLLDMNADIGSTYPYERTAVEYAVFFNREYCLEILLKAGANVDSGSNYSSALQLAAMLGSVSILEKLLKTGVADLEWTSPSNPLTAFQLATHYSHGNVIKLLLQSGAMNKPPCVEGVGFTSSIFLSHLAEWRITFIQGMPSLLDNGQTDAVRQFRKRVRRFEKGNKGYLLAGEGRDFDNMVWTEPLHQAVPGNHALQDYQLQLKLLEQVNTKRLLMARDEQMTMNDPVRPRKYRLQPASAAETYSYEGETEDDDV